MDATAIIFDKPGSSTLGTVALPTPTPADLVVETLVSGISIGTERWALVGKRPEMKFPHIPGYMGVGRVVEAGAAAAARGYRVGQVVSYAGSRLPEPYASNSWMGGHLSHAVVDACSGADWVEGAHNFHRCAALPEGLDPIDAALLPLCAVAMRGIEMATIRADASVLVVGMGVIGQYAAQVCRLKGARVAVTDLSAERLAIARRLGAEWAFDPAVAPLAEQAAAVAPDGFDVIIDTASIPAVVNATIPLLKLFGTFVFQGWYPPPSGLDLNAFHVRLPTCVMPCSFTSRGVVGAARWARDGRLDSRSLISHTCTPSGAAAVYREIAAGSPAVLGAVIDWRKP